MRCTKCDDAKRLPLFFENRDLMIYRLNSPKNSVGIRLCNH